MKSTQKLNHGSFNRKLFIALMTCTMLSATTSTSVMAQENTGDDPNFILYDSSNDFTEDFIFKFGDEVFVEVEPEDDPDPDPTPSTSSYDIAYDISTWNHYLTAGSFNPIDLGQATPVETITIVGSPSLPLTCEFLTPAVDVPTGIILDGTTCELTGNPTEFGTWNVSIALRNSVGTASTPALMEIVALPDPTPPPEPSSYDISYDISTWNHYLSDDGLTAFDHGQPTPVETITIVGSPSLPLTCEFLTPAVDVPDGITLDGTTCELSGHPTEFGTWNVSIALRDSVGTASTPALMEIVASASGDVQLISGGDSDTLRIFEPFEADPIQVSGAIGDVTFAPSRSVIADGVNVSTVDGAIDPGSYINTADSNYEFTIDATDEAGRTFNPSPTYTYNVIDGLTFTNTPGYNFVTETIAPLDPTANFYVDFEEAMISNQMGSEIRYEIRGNYPGTVYTEIWDPNWYGPGSGELVYSYDDNGTPTITDVYPTSGNIILYPEDGYFEIDMTQAQIGTHSFELVAIDDHIDSYTNPTAAQIAPNEDSETIVLTLELGGPMLPGPDPDPEWDEDGDEWGDPIIPSVINTEPGYRFWRITGRQYMARQGTEIIFWGPFDTDDAYTSTTPFRVSFGDNQDSSALITGIQNLFDGDTSGASKAYTDAQFSNQYVFEFEEPIQPYKVSMVGQGESADVDSLYGDLTVGQLEYSSDGINWTSIVETNYKNFYDTGTGGNEPSYEYWYEMEFNLVY